MEIQNYDCYTERMAQSMWDKNWWIDKIDSSINTIIDFGCGDGELGKFIEHIFPNRFRYIGIDNNEYMCSLAIANLQAHPAADIYVDPSEIPVDINPDTSIIIMNSVLHELFTYCPATDIAKYLTDMKDFGARYVAIRDMHEYPITPFASSLQLKALDTIEKIHTTHKAYRVPLMQLILMRPKENPINLLLEFALKYRYGDNWEREVQEYYLFAWDWRIYAALHTVAPKDVPQYNLRYEDSFYIPFIYNTFAKDFGIDMLPIPSHKKVLYERIGDFS